MPLIIIRHEHHHRHSIEAREEVLRRFDALQANSGLTLEGLDTIMSAMDDLRAAVRRNNDAGDSFRTYIKGVVQQLKDAQAQNDPAAVGELIAELDAGTEKDVAAMQENTPVDPANPPA